MVTFMLTHKHMQSFNIACLYDCVYEDLTEKISSVYFNVHCI